MTRDRWVILDRDGVINADSDAFIKSPAEWLPLPGSLEALADLHRHGFRVAVFSNQSGLARGLFDAETLSAIHEHMRVQVEAAGGYIEGIFVCPHGPDDGCDCRKPKPGMLHEMSSLFDIDMENATIIGDRAGDIEAAHRVGARGWLVLSGKSASKADAPAADAVFANLRGAADALIEEQHA